MLVLAYVSFDVKYLTKSIMTIHYDISDGYAGGKAPHSVRIDDSDILACDTVEEAMVMIDEIVQDDFLQKVCPSWDDGKVKIEVQRLIFSR